jgi:SAM-dependent methyltransferase
MNNRNNRIVKSIQRRVLKYLLRGDNLFCPICNKGFITFLPYGVNRANALCPYCGSLERTRLFWLYVMQREPDFFLKTKRVLHIAPERILFNKFSSASEIDYYPGDLFTEGWKYPKGTIKLDVTDLKFENNFFDFVLCSHVLEHVPDDKKAMRELYRVLKPGGWAILQVPIEMSREITYEDFSITTAKDRLDAFGQFDHVRIYGRDYVHRLQEVGFEVLVIDIWNSLSPNERFKLGLLPEEDLFVVNKL